MSHQDRFSYLNFLNKSKQPPLVAVKGAGDLATGVMHRLSRAGFAVMATELPQPTALRRTVAFAEAVTQGQMTVEGITAQRANSIEDIRIALAHGLVPIVVDPDGVAFRQMQPEVMVEGTLSKYNRGHNLGRVYLQGSAEPNTGVPGTIGGYAGDRLLRAPCAGRLFGVRQIGDRVQAGEVVAVVKSDNDTASITAAISGILRGLVRDDLVVSTGMKVGDVDPRAIREHCFTISDKSRAIGGGVIEAILYLMNR